jgi:hypothetical protein
MKVQTIVSSVAISLALVAGAQAQTPRGDSDNTPFQGVYGQTDNNSVSREQVLTELAQAHAAGQTGNNGDIDNTPFTPGAESASSAPSQPESNSVIGSVHFGDIDNQPFQGV